MFGNTGWKRRSVVIAVAVSAGLSVGGMEAVHALGSGGGAKSPAPTGQRRTAAQRQAARTQAQQAAVAASSAVATNAHCGQTITASLTLNGDLFCTSEVGLIVSGNTVVLNLNGHLVFDSGTGSIGILVSGSHDTVEKGNVEFWGADGIVIGSVLTESRPQSDTIASVFATENAGAGISDGGTATTISNTTVSETVGNTSSAYGVGILNTGEGGVYKTDHELNNEGVGLEILGQHVAASANVADGNVLIDQTGNTVEGLGIWVASDLPNTLTSNVANNNGVEGILAQLTEGNDDGGGNHASGNGWATHEPGYLAIDPYDANDLQCDGVVCS